MTTLSPQQRALIDGICNDRGNILARARAGTGKTFTICRGLAEYRKQHPRKEVFVGAFNTRIGEELKTKLASTGVEVRTLHSAGFRAIMSQWRGTQIDKARAQRLAREATGADAPEDMVTLVRRLSAMGKNCLPMVKRKPADTEPDSEHLNKLIELAYEFDLDPDPAWQDDGWTVQRVATCAQAAMMAACRRDGTIDFDDQVFLAVVNGFARPLYDLVVIDEAQDMNAAQLALAYRLCKRQDDGGRLVVVGDDRQAIYRFRGADSGALDRMKAGLKAKELPLTITFRCARSIVEKAQELVPDYQAAPGAPEGIVRTSNERDFYREAQLGDAVLSRRNADLVAACMRLLRANKRARIEGKDVGEQLVQLCESFKARSWQDFNDKLNRWQDRELGKIRAKLKNKPAEIVDEACERIRDQTDTIHGLSEGLRSVAELLRRIRELFDDSKKQTLPAIVCSSVHKAKGLEWERVWLLDWTFGAKPKTAEAAREEANIEYVAITRAKRELVRVRRPKSAGSVL